MSVDDRAAILELIARYAYTWDSKDAGGWAALFTDNAVWESYRGGPAPAVTLRSNEERRRFAQSLFDDELAGVQTRHYQTGTEFLELSPDAARTRTMVLATRRGAEDAQPRPSLGGVYEDAFRKSAAGWRFAHRTLRGDHPPFR